MTLRTISYGGGVQSTALGVLAAQGKLDEILGGPLDAMLYSNVGDDSEHPATNVYVRDIFTPWAAERGVTVHELNRRTRNGEIETLYGRLMKEGSRSLPIPVRMSNGAPGTRSCTADFKIRVVGKWLREHGASENDKAVVAIGISTDEVQRVSNKKISDWETPVYPLIQLGLDRSACMQLILDAGLPVPHKSACFFCPFHKPSTWAEQRRDEPDLFWTSVELERTLNRRRDEISCSMQGIPAVNVTAVAPPYDPEDDIEGLWTEHKPDERFGECPKCNHRPMRLRSGDLVPPHAKDHVWFTRFNMPLDEAISVAQDQLFSDAGGHESCDEGYCWT